MCYQMRFGVGGEKFRACSEGGTDKKVERTPVVVFSQLQSIDSNGGFTSSNGGITDSNQGFTYINQGLIDSSCLALALPGCCWLRPAPFVRALRVSCRVKCRVNHSRRSVGNSAGVVKDKRQQDAVIASAHPCSHPSILPCGRRACVCCCPLCQCNSG